MTYWHVYRNEQYVYTCIQRADAIRAAQAIEAEGEDRAWVGEAVEVHLRGQTWTVLRSTKED